MMTFEIICFFFTNIDIHIKLYSFWHELLNILGRNGSEKLMRKVRAYRTMMKEEEKRDPLTLSP